MKTVNKDGVLVMGGTWSPERVERLKKLFEKGLSRSQIASELGGVTRNAVIGKLVRLGLADGRKPREQANNSGAKARQPRKARCTSSEKQSDSPQRALTQAEKISLIDSVIVPPITVTDEEVMNAFRQQMLYGRPADDSMPWIATRHGGAYRPSPFVPKCTEDMPGMVPCGKPTVGRTARCEAHGGNRIRGIKLTGQNHEPAHGRMEAAE